MVYTCMFVSEKDDCAVLFWSVWRFRHQRKLGRHQTVEITEKVDCSGFDMLCTEVMHTCTYMYLIGHAYRPHRNGSMCCFQLTLYKSLVQS